MTVQELAHWLTAMKTNAEREITEFQEKLTENPARAFRWADSAIKAAALIEVCNKIMPVAQSPNMVISAIKQFVLQRVIASAQFPEQSTSAMSNIMHVKTGQAWAEILEGLE